MNPFHPLNDDDKLDEIMELAQRVERVSSSGPDVAASYGEEGMTIRSIPAQEYHVRLTEKNAINAWVPTLTYTNESEVFYSGKQVRINSEDPTVWEDVENGMTWDFAFGNAGGLKERNSNPDVPVGEETGAVVLAKLERLDSTTPCWVFDYPSPLQQITNIVNQTLNYTDVTINILTLFPGTGTGTGTDDGGGLVIVINDGATVIIGGPGIWVFNNPVTFNGPVTWGNTFPLEIVTNVCPIPQVGTGTGTSGDQSFKIEKRTIYLPTGTVISDPTCVTDPVTCCYCCDPMPANTLYAVVTDISGCSCIPACLVLTYDSVHDAWFSTNIGDDCDTTTTYIRLHCNKFTSQWILSIVSGDKVTVLHLSSSLTAVCEPFSISAQFSSVTAPCTGSFSLVISNTVCDPNPPVVDVDCCGNLLPETLTATVTGKTGGCTCIPDEFALVWNPSGGSGAGWYGTLPGCDIEEIYLRCPTASNACGDFVLGSGVCTFSPDVGCSCDPINLVFTNADFTGCACVGTATLTITE